MGFSTGLARHLEKTRYDKFVNKLFFIEFFSQNGNEGIAAFCSVLNDKSIIKPVTGTSFVCLEKV